MKTRLRSEVLTSKDTLDLHNAFLKDTLLQSSKSNANNIFLSVTGLEQKLVEENNVSYQVIDRDKIVEELNLGPELHAIINRNVHVQSGDSFGERMRDAIAWCFSSGVERLVILGADSPQIQPEIIDQAFSLLDDYGIVIGPSPAGGIYLIGITDQFPIDGLEKVFEGVELSNLANLAHQNEISGYLLPELTDIDIEVDLIGLIAWLESTELLKSPKMNDPISTPIHTKQLIANLGLEIKVDSDNNREKQIVKKKSVFNQTGAA